MKVFIVVFFISDLTLGQWPSSPAPVCVGAQCVGEARSNDN